MAQRRFKPLLYCLLGTTVIILITCAPAHDGVTTSKKTPEGISEVYPVDVDQAWEIAKVVFRWEGRRSIEEHRDQGYMLSSTGIGPVAWGTVMGAWLEPVDEDKTRVTVITKRWVPVNPDETRAKETSFLRRFAQAVKIVKKGEPLPFEAPK